MQFKLPELGEGVHEGELVKWKVKPGDAVNYDQPLCEIMTDKATVEIPSAFQGKVAQLHVQEGKVVHVGELMLSFEGEGKAASSPTPNGHSAEGAKPTQSAPAAKQPASMPAPAAQQASAPAGASVAGRAFAAPAARKLARELGIEIGRVQGTGPQGRVMKEDLNRAASGGGMSVGMTTPSAVRTPKAIPARGGEERVPFRGLRKKIAEKMRQSKDHAAHFTYVEEADATELVRLRNSAKELGAQAGVKVTYLPFIMKMMVPALRQFPILNSSLDEEKGEIVYKHDIHIGLSVQTEDGLTAPVIKDVAHKTVLELAKEIQDVVDRARHKKLTLDDLQGSTITLTNAGSIGGLFATPVINYPEVAILGFNKIFRKPVVREERGREEIVIRDWTYFSISLDHRVVDGAVGAEFMKLFIKYVENPSLLVLESF